MAAHLYAATIAFLLAIGLVLSGEIQVQTVDALSELMAHLDMVEARFLASLIDQSP